MDSQSDRTSSRAPQGTPSVSVLVPIYNAARYLRHCLDSLATQDVPDMQVICIDDGSTDESPSIVAEYVARDPRFEVLTKANTGYGDSMNRGLDAARGEYVGILEADDFASDGMFSHLLSLARSAGADVVRSNYYEHEAGRPEAEDALFNNVGDGLPLGEPFSPTEHKLVLRSNSAIWTGLYRRKFLDEQGIRFLATPGASFQDTSFNLKTLMAARTVALTDAPTVHYRIDNASSSVHATGKLFYICDEYDEVWRFLRERPALYEAFCHEIPVEQFLGYRWNAWRIARRYRDEFYDRFVSDFAPLVERGLVMPEAFEEADKADITQFLDDPTALYERLWGSRHVANTLMVAIVGSLHTPVAREHALDGLTCMLGQEPSDVEIVIDDVRNPDARTCLGEAVRSDVRALFLSELCLPGTANVPLADLRGSSVRLAQIDVTERDVALVRAARAIGESALYTGLQDLVSHK